MLNMLFALYAYAQFKVTIEDINEIMKCNYYEINKYNKKIIVFFLCRAV